MSAQVMVPPASACGSGRDWEDFGAVLIVDSLVLDSIAWMGTPCEAARSGVQARQRRDAGQHRCLVARQLVEAPGHLVDGRDAFRQVDVGTMMARLAGDEALEERGQLPILHRPREQLQALAAPCLDQRHAEESVDQASRLRGSDAGHELGGVWTRALATEPEAARPEAIEDLLEVGQLLPGQPGERSEKLGLLGIAKKQAQRRRRRLLLAMGV